MGIENATTANPTRNNRPVGYFHTATVAGARATTQMMIESESPTADDHWASAETYHVQATITTAQNPKITHCTAVFLPISVPPRMVGISGI